MLIFVNTLNYTHRIVTTNMQTINRILPLIMPRSDGQVYNINES
jgi:hypothetical protein